MADLDQLVSQLWAAMASRGTDWLEAQVGALVSEQDTGSRSGGTGAPKSSGSFQPGLHPPSSVPTRETQQGPSSFLQEACFSFNRRRAWEESSE